MLNKGNFLSSAGLFEFADCGSKRSKTAQNETAQDETPQNVILLKKIGITVFTFDGDCLVLMVLYRNILPTIRRVPVNFFIYWHGPN
jgi:hypothetical protein